MKIHIVQKGDSLYKLANQYHVELDTLVQLNPQISNPEMIMPGMKIQIPSETKPIRNEPQEIKETKRNDNERQDEMMKVRPMQDIHLDEREKNSERPQRSPQVRMNTSLKDVGQTHLVDPSQLEQMRPHTVVYYCCCCKHHLTDNREAPQHMHEPRRQQENVHEQRLENHIQDTRNHHMQQNEYANDTYYSANGPFYHM